MKGVARTSQGMRAASTAPPPGARPPRLEAEREALEVAHLRRAERLGALRSAWLAEKRHNGRSARAVELFDEYCREEARQSKKSRTVTELVALAERDATRRAELFEAIRDMLDEEPWPYCEEAERVVMAVTVMLNAGRPMTVGEASRRMYGAWGEPLSEEAVYAAKRAGAIGEDLCGVLCLRRPVDPGAPGGWEWMYHALEKAVRCGAARYTACGIEMTGDGEGALAPRELAGAEAVMMGVNAYGEPYGLAERLRRNHGDGLTWAEATVSAYSARAEVGEAYAELVAQGRAPDPDPGPDWPMAPGA